MNYLISLQGSWEKKLIDRINNSEKHRKAKRKRASSDDDSTPPKKRGRPKKNISDSRYPQPMKTEGGDSRKSLEALEIEIKKEHPRKEVVLPLMKSCFMERRDFVINDASCAVEILQKYPALKLSSVVSQSFLCMSF